MAISFGPKNPVVLDDYPLSELPGNRGMSVVAQRKLDSIIPQVARKTIEAIRTDGHLAYVWNRNPRGSLVCSCSGGLPNLEDVPDVDPNNPVFDPQVVKDEIRSRFDDEGPGPASSGVSVRLRSGHVYGMFRSIGEQPKPSPSLEELDATQIPDQEDDVIPASPSGRIELGDIGDLLNAVVGDVKQCGICYGTGFVDGYTFISGKRLVLDTRSNAAGIPYEVLGADIRPDTRPAHFELDRPDKQVIWTLELPRYSRCLEVKILNNLEPARNVVVEARRVTSPESTWIRQVDGSWFNSLAGASGRVQVRVRCLESSLDATTPFTHVEILLLSLPLPALQLPQLQKLLNMDTIEALIQTEFEIEPTIPPLYRESIFELPDLGLLLKVVDVTNKQTAKQQIWGIIGAVRLVQPGEQLNLMRISNYRDTPQITYRMLPKGITETLLAAPSAIAPISQQATIEIQRGDSYPIGWQFINVDLSGSTVNLEISRNGVIILTKTLDDGLELKSFADIDPSVGNPSILDCVFWNMTIEESYLFPIAENLQYEINRMIDSEERTLTSGIMIGKADPNE